MNQKNIKVSIILPVYNAGKYISKCIDSILAQDNTNFELIIINDGSIDDSEDIINNYINEQVILLKQNNSGVSKARNLGLAYANGEFVIFVDADDYLVPNSLDARIRNAETTELLISRFYKVSVDGKRIEDRSLHEDEFSIAQSLSTLTSESKIGYQGYLWNKVFRRGIIEQNHIQFDEDIAYGEDRLFVAEYISHCNSVRVDSQIVYCYLDNSSGAMNSFGKITVNNFKSVLSELDGLNKLKNIIEQNDAVLARYITIQSFRTAISFARNANKDASKAKISCLQEAWKCLKYILMFPNNFYSPWKKVKAIGHFLFLR